VMGDAGRIRQVLLNLIGNAIKFTERGHIVVDVEYRRPSKTEGLFKFSIRDTGCGIPADKVPTLFTKFTQVDGSPSRRSGGTGLGLAIAKLLVELMGGAIGVESEPGAGSTFWFTLRLPLVSPEAVPPQLPVGVLRGIRALLVDEHEVSRQILHELCDHWGMCAEQTSSAEEALRLVRAAAAGGVPFRIALLDCHTLTAGGQDLARALDVEAGALGLGLVTLRSTTQAKSSVHCRDVGCRIVVRKPVRPEALFAAMTECLGIKVSWTACADEQDCHGALSVERRGEHPASPGYPRRVLLAEDNAINQKVALHLLEKMGCRVDVAANGREALAMVHRFPYDLVLMDVQMPEMDGLEATARIRERETNGRHVPIVAMTAGAMAEDRERCLESGMDDYIAKPVNPEQLRRVLAKWGSGRNEPASSSETLTAAERRVSPACSPG
jgi:two-component system, sensor histidine kinase and response regulator